jgi:hypothetical protein
MMENPLLNTVDLEILMHKDAHFGGSFQVMIDYYENDGIGVQEDFELDRIKDLRDFDKDGHLSSQVLPDASKNEVIFSSSLYKKFKESYEKKEPLPPKISDLILSEKEIPTEEINALVAIAELSTQPLLEILEQDHFYNPLNPGYGRSPINASLALRKIQNNDTIPQIFQCLGKSFNVDEAIINTLITFGKDGSDFLQERLESTPYTHDNYIAAMALSSFPLNDETATVALSLLKDEKTYKHKDYIPYLICICEGLSTTEQREEFIQLSQSKWVDVSVKREIKLIATFWSNNS